ncbi:TIGR03546 family protein [Teredinibacter franksiae]|uniref:TIGR03546 family protein n=2 Tax=Teredinibacter franksiae TaxID=2761453 RepID=UPI0016255930|nr:TIGR03546 family protein [Teredinibacter franksiae]
MHLLVKFFKIISSETNPWQIAFAIMLGMIVGITPLYRLHNLIILFIVLFFRVNIASFVLAVALFSGLAMLFDPLLIGVGESLLSAPSAQALWQSLYSSGLGRLTQFNHTLTMGSLVVSLVVAPVVLVLSKLLIVQYRERFLSAISKWKIVQMLRASTLVQRMTGLGE